MNKDKELKFKKLYLVSPKMSWKRFKNIHDKLVKDSGPTPVSMDKIMWEMIRDKRIYAGFCEEMKGDMWVGMKVPKVKELIVIS